MFALDVFTEGYGLWQTIGALFVHLVPTFIVVIASAISGRWEWIGASLFSALALLYLIMAWGRFPLVAYFAISGPLALVGVLFLVNWMYKAQLRAR